MLAVMIPTGVGVERPIHHGACSVLFACHFLEKDMPGLDVCLPRRKTKVLNKTESPQSSP